MGKWSGPARFVPHVSVHSRHANTPGTNSPLGEGCGVAARERAKFGRAELAQNSLQLDLKNDMRQGIAGAAVMLHLRSCYVSKAAILTIPAPLVPVENRSPA